QQSGARARPLQVLSGGHSSLVEGTRATLDILYWVIVGLIAGWIAGLVMKGSGYGVIGDIILGILGAIIGGWLMSLLGLGGPNGLIGTIIVAALGAIVLVFLARMVSGR